MITIILQEVEYKLRLTPGPDDDSAFPPARAHGRTNYFILLLSECNSNASYKWEYEGFVLHLYGMGKPVRHVFVNILILILFSSYRRQRHGGSDVARLWSGDEREPDVSTLLRLLIFNPLTINEMVYDENTAGNVVVNTEREPVWG